MVNLTRACARIPHMGTPIAKREGRPHRGSAGIVDTGSGMDRVLIGLDFGSESARGVLVEAGSGEVVGHAVHPYRHGVISGHLPDGTPLPASFVLQDAADYLEAAEAILSHLGRGAPVAGIGIDFTASSPLPAQQDGTPLSQTAPGDPHSYVKLWKHGAAQPWADRITAAGGAFLEDAGGRLSGNSLLAKAAEMAAEAPGSWAATSRFIEAGDWLVWRLIGHEARSLSFAAFKALYRADRGYPADCVPGLAARLSAPVPVGAPAGALTASWRERTGIVGEARVAPAMIDGHVIAPAVGAVGPGVLVGALGTSACVLLIDGGERAMPPGLEGVARDAVLPGFRSFEAGQAAFGDTLAWFARTFPRGATLEDSLASYSAEAERLAPGESGLMALDWWNGCRVPHGDSLLTGVFAGLSLRSTAAQMFRALMESLCFGTRAIVDSVAANPAAIDRVVMTSGLSLHSPFLMQIMADVLRRPVAVPQQPHLTALGAAIHGAVAAGVVPDFAAGATRFGAKTWLTYRPEPAASAVYDRLYAAYRSLGDAASTRASLHALRVRAGP